METIEYLERKYRIDRDNFNKDYGHFNPKDNDKKGWERYGSLQGLCYALAKLKEEAKNREHLEKEVKEHGNGAHILIPKKYVGKIVRVVI